MTLNELTTYDVSLRLDFTHAEGEDPSLVGVVVWRCNPDGQWQIVQTFQPEPFMLGNDLDEIKHRLARMVTAQVR